MTKVCDVIVSNCSNRIGYSILRSLHAHGLRVGVGCDRNFGMGHFSRYSSQRFLHPPYLDSQAFVGKIKQVIQQRRPTVYIPAVDDVFVVARHREELEDLNVRMGVATYDTLCLLSNKLDVLARAQQIGIPVPATIVPRNIADLRGFCKKYSSPIILKPIYSTSGRGTLLLSKNQLDASTDEFLADYKASFGDYVAQQYVEGTGYGVSLLTNQGNIRARFTHRRIRERTSSFGPSVMRVATRNPAIEDYAERLLADVDFHGVAMVEFRCDEDTGQNWLIEVNTRFWGSVALAIRSGVDFPHLLYRMAVEGDVEPVLDYREGTTIKWLLPDLIRCNADGGIRRVLSCLREHVDGYDDFDPSDPTAFVGEVYMLLVKRTLNRNTKLPHYRSLFEPLLKTGNV